MSDKFVLSQLLSWRHVNTEDEAGQVVAVIMGRFDTIYTVYQNTNETRIRRYSNRGYKQLDQQTNIYHGSSVWINIDRANNIILAAKHPGGTILEFMYITQWGAIMWHKKYIVDGEWLDGGVAGDCNLYIGWSFKGTLVVGDKTYHDDSFVAIYTPSGDEIHIGKIQGEISTVKAVENNIYLVGKTENNEIFVQTMTSTGAQINRMVPSEPLVDAVHDAAIDGNVIWTSGQLTMGETTYAFAIKYVPEEEKIIMSTLHEIKSYFDFNTTIQVIGGECVMQLEVADSGSFMFYKSQPVHKFTDQIVIGGPRFQVVYKLDDGAVILKAGRFAGVLEINEIEYDRGRPNYTGFVMMFVTPHIGNNVEEQMMLEESHEEK